MKHKAEDIDPMKLKVDNFYAYVIWIFKSDGNYLIFISVIAPFVLKH